MLEGIIKKLQIILALCLVIALILFYTPLGDLFNGEVGKKVKEFKKETEDKIEAKKEEVKEAIEEKKEEVKKEVEKVEDKIDSNIKEVEDKIKELKKLKLRDVIG
tara:strand:- start:821 stop:1135 length:315 start_codon:yes stop_codon:yes gene_type:complete